MAKKRSTDSSRPDNSIIVTTYEEFEAIVEAFSAGHINLLLIIGSHGLGKSRTIRDTLGEDCGWIQGNASAFGIYLKLWEFRDRQIVINDVDRLHSERNIRLLKAVCDTEPTKTLAWPTTARELVRRGIPDEFSTTSRVAIISNDWRTLNQNVAAVEDRGIKVVFAPTAAEVHRKTGEWFTDKEVYDWVGDRLHLVATPSMRTYVTASQLKHSGLDWKKMVPLAPENTRKRIVAELLADPTFETQEARAKEFTTRGGGCRATFFNHARKLRRTLKRVS